MELYKNIASLKLTIRNGNSEIIPDATVTLLEQTKTGTTECPESSINTTGEYIYESLRGGLYIIQVSAPGYLTQQKKIQFSGTRATSFTIVLGGANDYWYPCGDIVVPFQYDPNKIAFQITPAGVISYFSEYLDNKSNILTYEIRRESRVFLIQFNSNADSQNQKTVTDWIFSNTQIDQVGIYIAGSGNNFTILTNQCDLVLQRQMPAEMANMLRIVGITFKAINPSGRYILSYAGYPDEAYFETLKTIADSEYTQTINLRTIKSVRYFSDPSDFLYPEQWHHKLTNITGAWDELDAINPVIKYGDPAITIGIFDSGIESTPITDGAKPRHPDFIGEVSTGVEKIVRLYNFDTRENDNSIDYYDPSAGHGTMVASIAAAFCNNTFGGSGVAPGCKLLGTTTNLGNESRNAAVLEWLSGLSVDWQNYSMPSSGSALPNPLIPGTDAPEVVNNSWGFGEMDTAQLSLLSKLAIDHLATFGRKGRGTPNFFATGNARNLNTNEPVSIETYGAYSAHEKTIAVAASSVDIDGSEMHAKFSYFGSDDPRTGAAVDFCAPSHSAYQLINPPGFPTYDLPIRENNPPNYYAIVCGHFLHGSLFDYTGNPSAPYNSEEVFGKLADCPIKTASLDTTLIESAGPSATIQYIKVEDSSGLIEGQWLIIGDPYSGSSFEIVQVALNTGSDPFEINTIIPDFYTVKLQSALTQSFPAGTRVLAVSGLSDSVNAFSVSTNQITLTSAAGFTSPMLVMIGDISTPLTLQFHTVSAVSGTTITVTPNPNYPLTSQTTPINITVVGGELKTTITAAVLANTGPAIINVTSSAGFQVGQAVLIGNPGNTLNPGYTGREGYIGNSLDYRTEAAMIVEIPNSLQIKVNRLQTKHDAGTQIIGGRASAATIMGGTSSASPQAAAIAALVLSANNSLTWVEVRDIMRRTAVPIDLRRTASTPTGGGEWITPINHTTLAGSFTYLFDNFGNFIVNSTNQVAGSAVIPAGTSELTLTASASAYNLRQVIEIVHGTEKDLHVITGFDSGDPYKIYISPLFRDKQGGDTVNIGEIAYYSSHLGFGRLDAAAAVKFAKTYSSVQRDLYIRDTLTDNGTVATPVALQVQSPDIWIRNVVYTENSGSPEEVAEETITNALPDNEAGLHQKALKSSNRRIYARVFNSGTTYANLDAWVRFYVVLDSAGTTFTFPEHFIDNGNIQNGKKGVKFIGERFIPEGTIPAGGKGIFYLDWAEGLSDEKTALETNILVQVSPHDGLNSDGDIRGISNISRRTVQFADKISFYNDLAVPGTLTRRIKIPSDDIATPVTTGFSIEVLHTAIFNPQSISIKARFDKLNGATEEVIFSYSTSWGFNTPPTGGWISCTAPVKAPYGAGNAAGTAESGVLFNGNITVNYEYEKVTLTVISPVDNDKTHTLDVKVVYPENAESESEKTKIHFFTDIDLIDPVQNAADAYGPVSGNETTKFQVTSRHKALVSGTDPKAYAVCDGKILVQQNTDDANLVNILIRPENQGAVDFINVRYFVYRGIKKDSLIDPDNSRVAPRLTNDLTKRVWDGQDDINRSKENADPNDSIGPNSITDEPSKKVLGIHFVNTPGVDEVQKLDTDFIDELFFNPGPDFRQIPVTKGMFIGKFDKNYFGFDIITDGLGFSPTFGMIRKNSHVISVNAYVSSPPLQRLTSDSERLAVLNFIDPAAFYGLHFNNRVLTHTSAGVIDKRSGNDIFDTILTKFNNKDAVYLDIRNENGYPFNYFGNYTSGDIQLALQNDNSVSLSITPYNTQTWPILILKNNQFDTSTYTNTTDKNIIRLSLPAGDNDKPLVYLASGTFFKDYPIRPGGKNKFVVPEFGANPFSDEITIGTPNRSSLSDTSAVSTYVKLYYIRRRGAALPANEPKIQTNTFFDHLFPVRDVLKWNTTDNFKIITGINERFIEREDFATMAETGIIVEANRVKLIAIPTDVYYINKKEYPLFKSITGGSSNKPSSAEFFKSIFPKLALRKRQLQLSSSLSVSYVQFESLNSIDDPAIKNIVGIGMSATEFQNLVNDITTTQLNTSLHYPSLVITQVNTLTDQNNTGYYKYQLAVAGINTTGNYAVSTNTYEAHSADNLLISTDAYASTELNNDINGNCIEFDTSGDIDVQFTNFGKVIRRLKPFVNAAGTVVSNWNLMSNLGAYQTYGAGETTNFDEPILAGSQIKIPAGTRVILLDCKTLGIADQGSIRYVRIVCFYNKKFREGYVSEYAINSTYERVISTENLSDDELLDGFVNDALIDIKLLEDIRAELNTTTPEYASCNALLADVKTLVGDSATMGSLIQRVASGNILSRGALADRIRDLSTNTGLEFEFYYDQHLKKNRINIPATMDKYNQVIAATGIIVGSNYLCVPLRMDWTGDPSKYYTQDFYDEGIRDEVAANASILLGDLNGVSGSSQGISSSSVSSFSDPEEFFNKQKEAIKHIRDYLNDRNASNNGDPILSTPEAQWFLNPVMTDSYINGLECLQFIHYFTWNNVRTNFIAEGIPIDNSYGTIDSNNVLSVMIHEFNVSAGIDVVNLADTETHVRYSDVPVSGSFNKKTISETAWNYTRSNNFALFESHGFTPAASYLDSNNNRLGNDNNSKSQTIRMFLQRNPALGMIYLKYYLEKILL